MTLPRGLHLRLLRRPRPGRAFYQKPPAPSRHSSTRPPSHHLLARPHHAPHRAARHLSSIADAAQPRFRLAGIRFNPQTNGPSREIDTVALSLETIDGTSHPITGLPAKLKATHLLWSPDSHHIAFVQRADSTTATGANFGLELWLIDVATARAHRIGTLHLNAVRAALPGMPDSTELLFTTILGRRNPWKSSPNPPEVPTTSVTRRTKPGRVSSPCTPRGHAENALRSRPFSTTPPRSLPASRPPAPSACSPPRPHRPGCSPARRPLRLASRSIALPPAPPEHMYPLRTPSSSTQILVIATVPS